MYYYQYVVDQLVRMLLVFHRGTHTNSQSTPNLWIAQGLDTNMYLHTCTVLHGTVYTRRILCTYMYTYHCVYRYTKVQLCYRYPVDILIHVLIYWYYYMIFTSGTSTSVLPTSRYQLLYVHLHVFECNGCYKVQFSTTTVPYQLLSTICTSST